MNSSPLFFTGGGRPRDSRQRCFCLRSLAPSRARAALLLESIDTPFQTARFWIDAPVSALGHPQRARHNRRSVLWCVAIINRHTTSPSTGHHACLCGSREPNRARTAHAARLLALHGRVRMLGERGGACMRHRQACRLRHAYKHLPHDLRVARHLQIVRDKCCFLPECVLFLTKIIQTHSCSFIYMHSKTITFNT